MGVVGMAAREDAAMEAAMEAGLAVLEAVAMGERGASGERGVLEVKADAEAWEGA